MAIVDASGKYLSSTGTFGAESWRGAFLTSPGTPGSNFSYTTPVLPAGSYTVKVRGVDNHGLVTPVPSERHVTVSIPAGNTAPTAVLPAPVCTENVCQFDAKGSTDAENAAALTYTWNFGTGQGTATGPNPKKTFTAAGDLHVTLDGEGRVGRHGTRSRRTVTIAEPAGNTAPVPVINTPSCNAATKTCNFSAVGTTDNLGDSITYSWNFGDTANNTAAGAATAHVFTGARHLHGDADRHRRLGRVRSRDPGRHDRAVGRGREHDGLSGDHPERPFVCRAGGWRDQPSYGEGIPNG